MKRDAICMTDTAREIAALKASWMFVGKAFQDCNAACETCDYHRITEEKHPYGEGAASAFYGDCRLGEMASHKPQDCPAYQQQLSESEEA